MADYQRVVEYIRDVRSAPPQQVSDDLRQAAIEYAELCVQANDRLRQCSGFLQQGLRSEAIHLSEDSPNLLDLVAALDLPDAGVWAEFCQNTGLPVPPALQMDRAAQLNDAYAAEQPLEHLLNRHRLLALSRGPVQERLDIIRQLAAQDSAGAFWEKDIRVFEKARLKELPPAFHAAVKSRDFEAIGAIAAEIENSPWLEPVPDDLRSVVADAYGRMHRVNTESGLTARIPPLRAAFAAKNHAECVSLLTQWHDALKAAGLEHVSAELAAEIDPIVEWVRNENELQARQREFAAARENFSRLLNQDAPNHELEVALAKLQGGDEPPPEDLVQRYHAKLGQRLAASRGQFKARLALIGGVLVAMLIVVVALGLLLLRHASADDYAKRIHQAVAGRDIKLALSIIHDQEQRNPQLSGAASLTNAKKEAEALQVDYDHDRAEVKSLVSQFSPLDAQARLLADNKAATVDELLAVASRIYDGLTRAGNTTKLDWADADDHALATLRSSLEGQLTTIRQRAATLVRGMADTLSPQVDAISTSSGADGLAQLAAASAKLTPFRDMPGLDEATKTTVTGLLTRIDQKRAAIDDVRGQVADLQSIVQHAVSADDLKKALEAYVAKYPNAPISAEFSKGIESLPGAKAVEAWRDLVTTWGGKLAPASAVIAAKRIEIIQAYLAANPTSPLTATASQYDDYLKQASDALIDSGTWQKALGEMLKNQLLTDLAYIQISDGTRYYVIGDIKLTQRRINNQVSVTFEALDAKNPAKRRLIGVDPPLKIVTDKPVPVPHVRVALDIGNGLRSVDETNWDTWQFPIIDQLIKSDQMDPVVRGILMQQVLTTTAQVDGWAIADAYDKAVRDLTRQQLDNIVWYDTDHPVSDGIKDALKKTIEAVPSGALVQQKYLARRAELFKDVTFDYAAVSVLLKDDKGAWIIPASPPSPSARAWAVGPAAAVPAAALTSPATLPAAPASVAPLIPIAIVKDGKFLIDEAAAHDLPQGTLIFIGK